MIRWVGSTIGSIYAGAGQFHAAGVITYEYQRYDEYSEYGYGEMYGNYDGGGSGSGDTVDRDIRRYPLVLIEDSI
jgi:hypothetical protein